MSTLIFVFFLLLTTRLTFGFFSSVNRGLQLVQQEQQRTHYELNFQKRDGDGNNSNNKKKSNKGGNGGFLKGLSRFVPGVVRNRLTKSISPETDAGNRYHVRLTSVSPIDKRHVTTRLVRFCPDLTYETADDIVSRCIDADNKKSLVRVFNSLKQATELCDLLRKADPPITSELFDSKAGDVLIV